MVKKPPLGIMPRHIWDKKRILDLIAAIDRYLDANKELPSEWVNEYNELILKYKNVETQPEQSGESLKFDIYERINIFDNYDYIEVVNTDILLELKVECERDNYLINGNLIVLIDYALENAKSTNSYEHKVPVEIKIPVSRVYCQEDLCWMIKDYNIKQVGSRTLNLTGVLEIKL